MKELTTNKGNKVVVDDSFFEELAKHTWTESCNGWGLSYVKASIKGKSTYLHRLITKAQKGQYVDHIDGNTFNNQTDNLRVCTNQQNSWNSPAKKHGASSYKGVSKGRWGKGWQASIRGPKGRKYLGTFSTQKEAAEAYNRAAAELHGEFARLNVISL